MENVMIERVARAIAENLNGADPDWANIAARAAIEAMREPTEAMLTATQGHAYDVKFGPRECWRAMIDAALMPPTNS